MSEARSTMDTDNATGPQHAGDSARVEQFRAEIDELKLKGGSAENEKRLLALGVVLMVAGIALAVFGAIEVGTNGGSPADQRAYMAQGSLLGIALVIAGAALFVRYSLARYLRFWLIRSTYEGRSNADRVVDAIERASGLTDPGGAEAPAPAPAVQATVAPPPVTMTPPPATFPGPPPIPPSAAPAPGLPPT
jgi:hypothetical protein